LKWIRVGAVLWILLVVASFYSENGAYFGQKISDFVGYAVRVLG
jgi:hypothetical protein